MGEKSDTLWQRRGGIDPSLHPIDMIGVSTESFEEKYKNRRNIGSRRAQATYAEEPNPLNVAAHTEYVSSANSIPQSAPVVNTGNEVLDRDTRAESAAARTPSHTDGRSQREVTIAQGEDVNDKDYDYMDAVNKRDIKRDNITSMLWGL